VSAVVEATEERVMQLARRYATTAGRCDHELTEDLAQIGRITVWQAIGKFQGSSVAEFFSYVNTLLNGRLSDERKTATRQGVSRAIAANFESALVKANGDPFEAERICVSAERMGSLPPMSPETAYAARISWQGSAYLDAPVQSADGAMEGLIGHTVLRTSYGLPDDLIEPRDIVSAQRKATIDKVHETLDRLPGAQQDVLSAEFGIGDYPCYGDDYKGLAELAGVPVATVDSVREAARDNFRAVYLGGAPKEDAPAGETKCCTTCEMHKPIEAFYIRNKQTGARMATCTTCKKSKTKRFRVENADARAAQKRAYNARKKVAATA
jgi:RNA polymerase sigma factor (sigma-70 family)